MSFPKLNEAKINFDDYKYGKTPLNLLEKFNDMPFYHQLGSGYKNPNTNYIDQLISILKEGNLYCDRILKEKNIQAMDNTHPADQAVSRNEYVYLSLGTIKEVLTSPQITIEIPQGLVANHYPESYFCNDLMAFDPSKFIHNEMTQDHWGQWEKSILTVEDGIKVLAAFTEHYFTNHQEYINSSYGFFNGVNDITQPDIWFVPEFTTKETLPITNSSIIFHLIGYDSTQILQITNFMGQNGYKEEQLKTYTDAQQFKQYLISNSGL